MNLIESDSELAARVEMAEAMQRLGHALMAHRLDVSTSEQVRSMAQAALRLVDGLPPRDRVAEMAQNPRFAAALDGRTMDSVTRDGEVMDLFRDSVVSGRTNPMGIGLSVRREGDAAIGQTVLGPAFEGAPRRAHGGVVAAILDEVMGHVLPIVGAVAYTANLSIDYVNPTPLGAPLTFTARLRDRAGRKLWIEASGTSGEQTFVRAEALFLCVDVASFSQQSWHDGADRPIAG